MVIIYHSRCPRKDCGILLVSSHSVWWWQTPKGWPQTGSSCSTLWATATSRRQSLLFPSSPGEDFQCCTPALAAGRWSEMNEAPSVGEMPTRQNWHGKRAQKPLLLLLRIIASYQAPIFTLLKSPAAQMDEYTAEIKNHCLKPSLNAPFDVYQMESPQIRWNSHHLCMHKVTQMA